MKLGGEPLTITQSNVLRVVKAKLVVFGEKEKLEYIHSLSANFKRGILIISLWNEKGDHIGIVKYPVSLFGLEIDPVQYFAGERINMLRKRVAEYGEKLTALAKEIELVELTLL